MFLLEKDNKFFSGFYYNEIEVNKAYKGHTHLGEIRIVGLSMIDPREIKNDYDFLVASSTDDYECPKFVDDINDARYYGNVVEPKV